MRETNVVKRPTSLIVFTESVGTSILCLVVICFCFKKFIDKTNPHKRTECVLKGMCVAANSTLQREIKINCDLLVKR